MTLALQKLITFVLAICLIATGAICFCAQRAAASDMRANLPPCCRCEPKNSGDHRTPAHSQCVSQMAFVAGDHSPDAVSLKPSNDCPLTSGAALVACAQMAHQEPVKTSLHSPAPANTLLHLHCALIV
jgi:hypothetical protein